MYFPRLPLANLGGLPKVVEKEDSMSSFCYIINYLIVFDCPSKCFA